VRPYRDTTRISAQIRSGNNTEPAAQRDKTHTPQAASDPVRREVAMNHIARIGRSLTRRADTPPTHLAGPAAMAIPRTEPPRRGQHPPLPALARTTITAELHGGTRPHPLREKLRATILPARLPHAIRLAIHSRERPAGF
jgi:hypothetical protein